MGKLAVKRYVSLMMLILQLVVSIFTIVGLFGGDSSPVGNMASAMCVYVLPVFIIANILMLLYWLIMRHSFPLDHDIMLHIIYRNNFPTRPVPV